MAGQIYFGNTNFADWVSAPDSGMTRTDEGYAEETALDSGGIYQSSTFQTHISYDMTFAPKDASLRNNFELLERFGSGEYGSDYLRFIDPLRQDENLFSRIWAAPGLAELGWKTTYDTVPIYSATAANTYGKPLRKPTYPVNVLAANATPVSQNSVFTLLIPNGYTLSIGASYTVTGTAVIQVTPYLRATGAASTAVNLTAQADATAPSFTSTFDGNTYSYVKIYYTATSTSASTITPVAMWAQVLPTAQTAVITRHIPGKGHSGLKFRGSSRAQSYLMQRGHLIGYAGTLIEVEPWA